MAEDEAAGREPDEQSQAASSPAGSMAQVDPDAAVRYHEADARHMLNELTGDVGMLKERLSRVDARAETDSRRIDDLSRKSDEILRRLTELTPKLDDVAGFIKHGVPSLAKKTDLQDLSKDIEKRPTRRQSIFDILAFIGLVGTLIAITLHFAK